MNYVPCNKLIYGLWHVKYNNMWNHENDITVNQAVTFGHFLMSAILLQCENTSLVQKPAKYISTYLELEWNMEHLMLVIIL